MALTLQTIHPDHYKPIYDHLFLSDLIRLRKLCRPLNDAFLVHSRARRHLEISIEKEFPETIGTIAFHQIAVPSLNRQICHFITITFPNVTHLVLTFRKMNGSITRRLNYLLTHYAHRLVSLKLFISFERASRYQYSILAAPDVLENMQSVVATLNQLPALRQLDFNTFDNFMVTNHLRFDLPVLGHLTHFKLYSRISIDAIYDSLVRYALPNANLEDISIDEVVFGDQANRRRLFDLDQQFTRRFTCIGFYSNFMTGPEFIELAPKFTNLKCIKVCLYEPNAYFNLTRIFALLATHMGHLETLRLTLNFATLDAKYQRPLQLTPLPSVEHFQLTHNVTSHSNIAQYLNPRVTFPNLHRVTTNLFDWWQCRECQTLRTKEEKDNCRELLEAPFYECPQLAHGIKHDDLLTDDEAGDSDDDSDDNGFDN